MSNHVHLIARCKEGFQLADNFCYKSACRTDRYSTPLESFLTAFLTLD